MATQDADFTTLLTDVTGGRLPADALFPLLYDELRALAASYLSRERSDHTLQPTALVHEAYLRLVDQTRVNWESRTHFFAAAAITMRRLLVDSARRRLAAKRGGDRRRVDLEANTCAADHPVDVLELDEALEDLAAADERSARVVELRAFAGLSIDEIATILGLSRATAERDWASARAWLLVRLSHGASDAP